jgi:hypothetical protein
VRHISENWQHRQFVIVIPKKQRIVPEQDQAKDDGRVIRLRARRESPYA